MDMKLKVVVIPVADVDRAKAFWYARYLADERSGEAVGA